MSLFRCGHEKTPDNIRSGGNGGKVCRTCYNANMRTYRRADPQWRDWYRRRALPEQLDLARRKVLALETEARRYGMTELLEGQF